MSWFDFVRDVCDCMKDLRIIAGTGADVRDQANELKTALQRRVEKVMASVPFCAALYLDPRYGHRNMNIISPLMKQTVLVSLN